MRLFSLHYLRNRMVAAFVLLILIPFSLLTAHNFNQTETLLKNQMSFQEKEQLANIKGSFESVIEVSLKTLTLLEQDSTVTEIMSAPDKYSTGERVKLIENKFSSISNSFFLSGSQVYYTLLDYHGNVYTSYSPRKSLNYNDFIAEDWYKQITSGEASRFQWNGVDTNYVHEGLSKSPYLISVYSLLKADNLNDVAAVRISIDYRDWFKALTGAAASSSDYFIMDNNKNLIFQSNERSQIESQVVEQIIQSSSTDSYIENEQDNSMYSYSSIPLLNWYVVKKLPLDILFYEVNQQKQQFYLTSIMFALLFVTITYLISYTITNPLKLLQKKMETVVKTNFKNRIPEKGKGEILYLTQSFNRMIVEINDLIQKLKIEERQKEAVRFQALISQMNPHFLLNTLHTIKSIALLHDEDEIHDICVSLGRILETSLNLDVDLIHLKEEIHLVESFTQIQKFRFGDKFAVVYEYDDDLQFALVPKFSLQPLVENAISHGLAELPGAGVIRIHIYLDNHNLIMEVIDNGVGMEKSQESKKTKRHKGIGLHNLKERLALLFPRQAQLVIMQLDQGTKVRLELPLLLSTPYTSDPNSLYKGGELDVERANR